LQKVFPERFRVRSVWLEEEVCYVNLSSALLAEAPEMDSGALEKALNAIGKSMCSLGSVSETRFLVDGEFAVTYGGVDISKTYN
jgi:germination protein M